MSRLVEGLNEAQKDAVIAPERNMLILAGAGSGKTRVLVHRVGYLIQHYGVDPSSILAVTFTNKAAGEMRGRISELLGGSESGVWSGTFHSICHRLLRRHSKEAGIQQSFTIIDSDDQKRIIKRVMKEADLSLDLWDISDVISFINGEKDEARRPWVRDPEGDYAIETYQTIYELYQNNLTKLNMLDFGDLIMKAYEALRDYPGLRTHYQNRFRHVLVDEFQDTNTIQYLWLRLLTAGSNSFLTVVGDDDQSIYGWRGAKISNIRNFATMDKGTVVVKLEQNYRSTGTILDAANAVIDNNDDRLGKRLWTSTGQGDPIHRFVAHNEYDEADTLTHEMQSLHKSGIPYASMAVLYRSNVQSRVIEQGLLRESIPYRIHGGARFYERQEIKNALAYLRLLTNPADDEAFLRVVNLPTRGVGKKAQETLVDHAKQHNCSLWTAASHLIGGGGLTGRAKTGVTEFIQTCDSIRTAAQSLDLADIMNAVILNTGLVSYHLEKEKGEAGISRKENLEELVSAAKVYTPSDLEIDTGDFSGGLAQLVMFLADASLDAGDSQAGEDVDAVQMMTLHSAKGLEFPYVFMVGLEDGLFPNKRSLEDSDRLLEERRLCYVGITRAEKRLYILHAQSRRIYGQQQMNSESMFIREIPEDLVCLPREIAAEDPAQDSNFAIGSRVGHFSHGMGEVVETKHRAGITSLKIMFDSGNTCWVQDDGFSLY